MTRKQCDKCPWKVTTNPYDIPSGYDVEKHKRLANTIAKPGDITRLDDELHVMACHETVRGKEVPCVGWLDNQLGAGNNIALRLAVHNKRFSAEYELDGEQHERFEDTLPKPPGELVARLFRVFRDRPELKKITNEQVMELVLVVMDTFTSAKK